MSSLLEAYKDDPKISHHVIPLDFESIDGVPESHKWSHLDQTFQNSRTHIPRDSLIPVIDLTDPNAVEVIGQACRKWGMFQVINHGVPLEIIEKVEFETHRLFALPIQEKCKVLRSPGKTSGYGLPQTSRFYSKCMWHEGFTIIGSCVDDAKVLWPHDYQRFSDAMDAYRNQMKQLYHNIVLLMLQTLDVTQEEMDWASSTHDNFQTALQLNSYPSCPNPSDTIGLAPHTDSLFLTLLYQGNVNGLEIFVEGSGWNPVRPVKGAFVVNVGDLFHIFSNATFPTLVHRAIVNQTKHRISVACFFGPSLESVVAPSSRFHNPCFKSLLVKEFMSLKSKHFTKALSMIRK